MNRKTVSSIAFGTLIMASYVILLPTSTFANTSVTANHRSQKKVIKVAQSTKVDVSSVEKSIFDQINQYRASKGLPAFTRNSKIDNQARTHSQNMASGKIAFGHQDFSNRVKSIGISYKGAAENVAYNKGFADPATQAVQGWLKSSGHKANIEGRYNQTGIGVATNSKGEVYFTEIFINQ